MTMHAVTDRPGVIEVGPLATPEPPPPPSDARPTSDGPSPARGAKIATAIALFPWSLLILLLAWLF
jgi:hypothetical protein